MRWSIGIGKIFGIQFRIHLTFILLLFFIFMSGLSQYGPEKSFVAVLFICAVFITVLIHEITHSLIARRYGKEARSITLLPIGGVAAMEEMPEKPMQEILMSAGGPLINLVIAGILYLIIGNWSGIGVPNLYPGSARAFFAGLIGINIILAIFNLVPAFPMDGGRVLRGILAMRMGHTKATSVAVSIGQAFAFFFIFFGLFFNLWLAIIGVFLYIGAGSEKQHVMLQTVLRRVKAREAMITDYRSVKPEESLSKTLEHVYHGCQQDFPVVGKKGFEGILTRDRILAAIHEKGVEGTVADAMDRDFVAVSPFVSLDRIYKKIHSAGKTVAAVLSDEGLEGLVSLDGISRYFMIQSALKGIEVES